VQRATRESVLRTSRESVLRVTRGNGSLSPAFLAWPPGVIPTGHA
jgi:hypothetical protein